MRSKDFIKMGLKNLTRRKLRTSLTILGVVIGTFSIVVMMSLGIAMSEGFEEQIMHYSECIINGLKESLVVTPEQTLYITEQMDKIRKIVGVEYPQDKNKL